MGAPNAVLAAMIQCTFGLAPASLMVIPRGAPVLVEGKPAATVADSLPIANITPFGMCTSLTNPMVAAATAAALGVLTPMPCIPATVGQWLPGAPRSRVNGSSALTAGSTLMCAYSGLITLVNPGTMRTMSG